MIVARAAPLLAVPLLAACHVLFGHRPGEPAAAVDARGPGERLAVAERPGASDRRAGADVRERGARPPIALETITTGQGSGGTYTAVLEGTGLFLAAIATKPFVKVNNATGALPVWQPLASQCGGDNQTGLAVWWASGTAAGGTPLTVVLDGASSLKSAVLTVARFKNASAIGAVAHASNGSGTSCAGNKSAAYSFAIKPQTPDGHIVAAIGTRQYQHTPGGGFLQATWNTSGSNGDAAGLAIAQRATGGDSTVTVSGTFASDTDWAVVALELLR
jgi:hypothetical protein